jgi:putative oxidoreductase
MTSYAPTTERNLDRALLVLRLVLGVIFIVHGYQKVFGYGISGVTESFTHMGIPLASVVAPFISVIELLGGIALIFGAFTRVAAFLLACDMLGAMIFVHAKNGFSAPKGIENVLGNFAMAVAIALVGAGLYSVDAMLARRNSRVTPP